MEGELQETKASLAELQGERDELGAQLGTTEAELQNVQDCLEAARWGRADGQARGAGGGPVAGWLTGSGLLLAGGALRCPWLHLPPPPPWLHRHQCSAPLPPRLPALAACCRTDLASKEEALATLTSEKAELEARHNELR